MIDISNLIINGDDYGLTKSSTLAITEAFNQNIISSATVCSNGEYYNDAIHAIFKYNLQNKIGIHLNLTQGMPVTAEIKTDNFFCDENGLFHNKINRKKSLTAKQKQNAYNELTAQYKKTVESKIEITHIDSHHHIHTASNMISTFNKFMKDNNIQKLRATRNIGNIAFIKRVEKSLYNMFLHVSGFKTTDYFCYYKDLKYVKDFKKSLEVMVHPDFNVNNEIIDRKDIDDMNNPIGKKIKFDKEFLNKYLLCSYYDGI